MVGGVSFTLKRAAKTSRHLCFSSSRSTERAHPVCEQLVVLQSIVFSNTSGQFLNRIDIREFVDLPLFVLYQFLPLNGRKLLDHRPQIQDMPLDHGFDMTVLGERNHTPYRCLFVGLPL